MTTEKGTITGLFEGVSKRQFLMTAVELVARFKKTTFLTDRLDQGILSYISDPDVRDLLLYDYYKSPENEVKRGWVCGVALLVQLYGKYKPSAFDLAMTSLAVTLANEVDDLTEGKSNLTDKTEIKNYILRDKNVKAMVNELYMMISSVSDKDKRDFLTSKTQEFLDLALLGVAEGNKLIAKGDYNYGEYMGFRMLTSWNLGKFQMDLMSGRNLSNEERKRLLNFIYIGTEVLQYLDDLKDWEEDDQGKKSPNIVRAIGGDMKDMQQVYRKLQSKVDSLGVKLDLKLFNEIWESMTKGSYGYLIGFWKIVLSLIKEKKD